MPCLMLPFGYNIRLAHARQSDLWQFDFGESWDDPARDRISCEGWQAIGSQSGVRLNVMRPILGSSFALA